MSNDDRVAKLEKKLDISLSYSDTLKTTKTASIDKNKLEKLAKRIRKEFEEMSLENSIYTHPRV